MRVSLSAGMVSAYCPKLYLSKNLKRGGMWAWQFLKSKVSRCKDNFNRLTKFALFDC